MSRKASKFSWNWSWQMVLIISRQPEPTPETRGISLYQPHDIVGVIRWHGRNHIQPNLCDYLPTRGPLPAVSFLGCRSLTNQLHGLNQSSTLLKLQYVRVSKNRGVYPPKSSILIGFGTIINHPFWVFSPIFGLTPMFHPQKTRKNTILPMFYQVLLYQVTLQGTNIPYPTKQEKENHLQNTFGKGYVSSQEGINKWFVASSLKRFPTIAPHHHSYHTILEDSRFHSANQLGASSSFSYVFFAINTAKEKIKRIILWNLFIYLKHGDSSFLISFYILYMYTYLC